MQYGLIVAVLSVLCYLISGFTQNGWIGFIAGFVMLVVFVIVMKKINPQVS